jgi:DNA-binding CsgD family transcriptional regulator
VPTVNTYIRRIYEKLQVHSRSQAIAKYLKQPV